MQIIIVGGGKVGRTLIAQLSKEGNNITVVDENPHVIRDMTIIYDVMGVVGNGTSYNILAEAGLDQADMLIAVTQSDEVNLLCCVIAHRTSSCKTIARVRNPIYSKEQYFLCRELELSMTINPELEAAQEIASLLRFPNAIEVDSFAKDRIDLLRFRVPGGSAMIGRSLKEISGMLKMPLLVCIAERKDQVTIPNGDYVVADGDILSIISPPRETDQVFRKIGIRTDRVRSCMIIGGGGIAYYLTEILLRMGIDVKIVEQSHKRCMELNEIFPDATIVCGDGSDREILREEHIENMDALVACTGIDEVNAILSLYGQNKVKKKVITKLNHIEFNEVIDNLHLDSQVNPKQLTAQRIVSFVRATGNSMDSKCDTLYRLLNGRAEALSFRLEEGSRILGIRLMDMKLKDNVLIAGIVRNGKHVIPGGQDSFCAGDTVIVVTTHSGFDDIYDILAE
ncbi:MAG: Trk system potassium transporter TrkA [Eubacteriales bacterium]|nr:Trk system potassium transporter TrkA [Eubacteriales bacterium]